MLIKQILVQDTANRGIVNDGHLIYSFIYKYHLNDSNWIINNLLLINMGRMGNVFSNDIKF